VKHLRDRLAVALTRFGLLVIPVFPRPFIVALARVLGTSAYIFALRARRIGFENLDLVYGDSLTNAEKKHILRSSFRTFALALIDIFWFTRFPHDRLKRYVHFDENSIKKLSQTPLICITGHIGGWETLGQAVPSAGFPVHSVAAPLSNPGVDQLFIPSRELSGQTILPKKGALPKLLRILKQGGRLSLLLDQNTRPSEGGLFTPFLGLPAPVSSSAALLALRTGCSMLFGFAIPDQNGTYHVMAPRWISAEEVQSIAGAHVDPIGELTHEIVKTYEEVIRTYPGHWIWMYKRWKFIAPGHDRAVYPSYAKHP